MPTTRRARTSSSATASSCSGRRPVSAELREKSALAWQPDRDAERQARPPSCTGGFTGRRGVRHGRFDRCLRHSEPGFADNEFPFGVADLLSGDGGGTAKTGDAFDREHLADLSGYAGDTLQLRFRFGANGTTQGTGAWIDTVSVYGPYVADAWPGAVPPNLQGSDANCPAAYDLTWGAVTGAEGYDVYRSETSCADAAKRPDVYGTSVTPAFQDAAAVEGTQYYYAVAAREAGSGCPTERSCIPGGCLCVVPADPSGLRARKSGNDLWLEWNDPGVPGLTWNVYRDPAPDPTGWGPPHATGVTDQDPGTPGIQYLDVGALSAGSPLHYLITASDACGESPLR